MTDSSRWKTLPKLVPLSETTASHPILEHTEPLPDRQQLDEKWVGHWYA